MSAGGVLAAGLVALTCWAARAAAGRGRTGRVFERLAGGGGAAGGRDQSWRWEPPPRVRGRLEDAALPGGAATAWTAWCGLGAALVALAVVAGGPTLAVLSVGAWSAAGALVLGLRRGAAGRAVEEGLPEALEAMARSLRSGAGTHQALIEVAEATPGLLGEELCATTRDLAAGAGLEPALGALARRRGEPGVRLAVAALLLGADAGGAHARALDGVAASVRARLGIAREVRAMSSQARLSALVIGLAPIAFAVLAAGMDGEGARFLLRTPLGLACLTVGLGLDGLGALWMHRLAQVDGG